MADRLPALSLAAVPGRRRRTIELSREIERRGFTGIYGPSMGDSLALSTAISVSTSEIHFGTSITPIYTRPARDLAQTAAFLHEVSDGRFRLGLGVSHAPVLQRLGVKFGKPLADTRAYVAELRAAEQGTGELPPITLAALRKPMIRLAGEIAEGIVFANGACSHVPASLGALPTSRRNDEAFFVGNMVPTIVDDDVEAAKARHRATLTRYAMLPNYRNYWREAGYGEEMDGVENALSSSDTDGIAKALSDRWLEDVTEHRRAELNKAQLYPPYSAGRVMTPRFLALEAFAQVASARPRALLVVAGDWLEPAWWFPSASRRESP